MLVFVVDYSLVIFRGSEGVVEMRMEFVGI